MKNTYVGRTGQNRLGTTDDGLHTGSADLVDSSGYGIVTKASLDSDLASRSLADASTVDVAKNDLLDVGGLDLRNLSESS